MAEKILRKGFVYSLFSVLIIMTLTGLLSINANSDIDKNLTINID